MSLLVVSVIRELEHGRASVFTTIARMLPALNLITTSRLLTQPLIVSTLAHREFSPPTLAVYLPRSPQLSNMLSWSAGPPSLALFLTVMRQVVEQAWGTNLKFGIGQADMVMILQLLLTLLKQQNLGALIHISPVGLPAAQFGLFLHVAIRNACLVLWQLP